LQVAQLEADGLRLQPARVELAQWAEAIAARWQAAAQLRNRKLALNLQQQVDSATFDQAIIDRVLDNLVDNGLRHTPRGSTVSVIIETQSTLTISVVDEGVGVPADARELVFSKFGRSEGPKAGRGLGLYFCRLAVNAHGGTIAVREHEGKNAFVFELPLHPRSKTESQRTQ
jgi:two-component system sensor histidine kinase/response regulator